MNNEKIENLLNLALDATEQEREKSLDLGVGFDKNENVWEVIVKFFGSREELEEVLKAALNEAAGRIIIQNLQNEYAILRIPRDLLDAVAALPEIEYMEKPKRLFFAVNNGKSASCINPLQAGNTAGGSQASGWGNLSGRGVITAVIDSGIDYSHPDFRNADGTTRILSLWDQTVSGGSVPDGRSEGSFLMPPAGFALGTEFPAEIINRALEQPSEQLRYQICPSRDISGHGTHVNGSKNKNNKARALAKALEADYSVFVVKKCKMEKQDDKCEEGR